MSKGISQVILVILLMMIGISLASLTYLFATGTIFEIFPSETFKMNYMRSRACVSLERVEFNNTNVTIKNCGLVPLTNFDLYIDLAPIHLGIDKLEPQESKKVYYGVYVEGVHTFIVFADYAETPFITWNTSRGIDSDNGSDGDGSNGDGSEDDYSANRSKIYNTILLIERDPEHVMPDNISTSLITVRAIDQDGNPWKDKEVSFTTSWGYLDTPSNFTDDNGYTTNRIRADLEGTAVIQAELNLVSNMTTVIFSWTDNYIPIPRPPGWEKQPK